MLACDMTDGCGATADEPCAPGCPSLATDQAVAESGGPAPVAPLVADIADYIGDGSAHAADHLPLPAVSILDEIAEAQRRGWHPTYLAGLRAAYRVVTRHRFVVRHSRLAGGSRLVDTWTGDSPAYVPDAACSEQAHAANLRNAEVFVARIDRDIAEGGL